jgi:TIR domain
VANIFVSFTSNDRDWAFWIGLELEKLGHVPHIHEWELSAGGDIPRWMEESLEKADHCLLVISKIYLTKSYASWERRAAQWAANSKRPNFTVPVFIEACEPPILLAHLKRCDLHGLSEKQARATLAEFLKPAQRPTKQIFPGAAPIAFPGRKNDPHPSPGQRPNGQSPAPMEPKELEAAAEAAVMRISEESFPRGLRLLDYQPGIRLEIKDVSPVRIWDGTELPLLLGIVITTALLSATLCSSSSIPVVIIVPLAVWFWADRKRRGTVVKLNIRKRKWSVAKPFDGGLVGVWPPFLGTTTDLDPLTGQWTTSLHLCTVRISKATSATPDGGRAAMEPFIEALQTIAALKRHPRKPGLSGWLYELLP